MNRLFRKTVTAVLSAAIIIGSAVAVLPQASDGGIAVSAAAALKLSSSAMSVGKGESVKLTANQSVKWRTSSSKILTVDQKGNVKAVGNGTAWVTAKNNSGVESSCRITVKNAPTSVGLSKTSLTLGVGETYTLSSSIPDGSASASRTFRSSNSSIINMTKTNWTGSFKAMKTGTAWVTVRTFNGKEKSCKITVKKAPGSVSISKKNLTLAVGKSASLSASIASDAGCASRIFRSSNSNIIKMTKTNWTGDFKAVGTGTAWVTVRTYNGKEASCKVVVTGVPATSLKLNKTEASMIPGKAMTLKATVSPSNTTDRISWMSSNEGVATVSNGVVKAVAPGKAKIIAKSSSGKLAYCMVTVNKYTGFRNLEYMLENKNDGRDSTGCPYINGGTLTGNEFKVYLNAGKNSTNVLPNDFKGGTIVQIRYDISKDKVQFIYADFTKELVGTKMAFFEADFNNTFTIKPMYGLIITGDKNIPAITMSSQISSKNYKNGMTLPFRLYQMDGYNVSNSMKTQNEKLANQELVKAMKLWDQLLIKKYGIHLKDIGFDKYVSAG